MDKNKVPRDIISVVDGIAERFDPVKIYLFSDKRETSGKTAGFKLCVVFDCDGMAEIERRIYLEIDCEVPFDVVLYKLPIWNELLEREGSFAQRVVKKGALLYG